MIPEVDPDEPVTPGEDDAPEPPSGGDVVDQDAALQAALADLTSDDASATAKKILGLPSDEDRLDELMRSVERVGELPLAPLMRAIRLCLDSLPGPKAAVETFQKTASPSKADQWRLVASLAGDPKDLEGTVERPLVAVKMMRDNTFKEPRADPPAVYVIRQNNAGGKVHDPHSESPTMGRPAAARMVGLQWLVAVVVEEDGTLCMVYGRQSHPLAHAFATTVSETWQPSRVRLVPPILELHPGPWRIAYPPTDIGDEIRLPFGAVPDESSIRMMCAGDAAYLVLPGDPAQAHAICRIAGVTRNGSEWIVTFDRWQSIAPPAPLVPAGAAVKTEADEHEPPEDGA